MLSTAAKAKQLKEKKDRFSESRVFAGKEYGFPRRKGISWCIIQIANSRTNDHFGVCTFSGRTCISLIEIVDNPVPLRDFDFKSSVISKSWQ